MHALSLNFVFRGENAANGAQMPPAMCYNRPMQKELLAWYDACRRDLPWRRVRDPYAVWLSEIMLQQTRVETVRGYWTRFVARWPDVRALSAAREEDVLKAWEGLGYYSRAHNLLACAHEICEKHGGAFPRAAEELRRLPGIGEYTAGAVASIAFGQNAPAVDGNVERVTARLFGIREDVGIPSVRRALRERAAALMDAARPGDWNQAMMELGACVCLPGAPRCAACPLTAFCDAYAAGDAAELPVKARKAPPKTETRGVALVMRENRALVRKRGEGMLRGLWEFPHAENAGSEAETRAFLACEGVRVGRGEPLGHARHVFTHRVWEMELFLFYAEADARPAAWRWAGAEEIAALPMPTAMKAARERALERLTCLNLPAHGADDKPVPV